MLNNTVLQIITAGLVALLGFFILLGAVAYFSPHEQGVPKDFIESTHSCTEKVKTPANMQESLQKVELHLKLGTAIMQLFHAIYQLFIKN